MATLILITGSEGAGIQYESNSLLVFGVHPSASADDIAKIEACQIETIIVTHGVIIGQQTKAFVDGLVDGFYQANVIYLRS